MENLFTLNTLNLAGWQVRGFKIIHVRLIIFSEHITELCSFLKHFSRQMNFLWAESASCKY